MGRERGGTGILFVPEYMSRIGGIELQLILDATGLLPRLGDIGRTFLYSRGNAFRREETLGDDRDDLRAKFGLNGRRQGRCVLSRGGKQGWRGH